MTQLIERAAVEAVFGSAENLDAEIEAFQKALKKHAKSKNTPAPTAHGVVEVIVRQHGGGYKIVDPVKPEVEDVSRNFVPTEPSPPPPALTFEEQRQEKLGQLSDLRYQRQMDGIVYKDHPLNGDPLTLNAIMAALLAAQDEAGILVIWKDAHGDFFEIDRDGMMEAVKSIRALTQACFANEYRLTKMVKAAEDARGLSRINLTGGWPE